MAGDRFSGRGEAMSHSSSNGFLLEETSPGGGKTWGMPGHVRGLLCRGVFAVGVGQGPGGPDITGNGRGRVSQFGVDGARRSLAAAMRSRRVLIVEVSPALADSTA
jgi:hypothetical protein